MTAAEGGDPARLRVAVMGGSLAGLNAALWLRALGCEVTVYERSPSPLRARGAGIAALHQTLRYLEAYGPDPQTVCSSTNWIQFLHPDGVAVAAFRHRYRFTSWNSIYGVMLQALGPQQYRLGCPVESFEDLGDRVRVQLGGAGGAGGAGEQVEVDLLICADGVSSTARGVLAPQAQRRYAGYVAWRGTVPERELSPATMTALSDAITYQAGGDHHILVYPIPRPDGVLEVGRRLMNMVWYRNVAPGAELTDLMTDVEGRAREVSLPPGAARPEHLATMRDAAEGLAPAIAEVVDRVAEPFVQAIMDVEVPLMTRGRVALIGDAAFAVRPHAAAGTAKAAEDGWRLAEELRAADFDVPAALDRWNSDQVALGHALLERTRRIGDRSQFGGGLVPGEPDLIFGLYRPGD